MGNRIDICKDSAYTSVFLVESDQGYSPKIIDFYLYRIANEKDSPLSYKIDTILTFSQKDDLYSILLSSVNITEENFLFSSLLRNKINDIRSMKLSDTTLACDRIKGFFHQNNIKNGTVAQHKIDALFKHVRDAFAHGRIAVSGEYLIIEDKVNEFTGRLIITMDALSTWKKEIEKYLRENNLLEDN